MTAATTSLIIDTDAGLDDFLAIQCLLHRQPLITTVGGALSASRGATTLRQLFPSVQTIAIGKNSPVSKNPLPNWLDHYRSITVQSLLQSRGISKSNASDNPTCPPPQSSEALTHVMDLLMCSSSVDILCLGPLTNLSHWLTHCDISKIGNIWIMGGNHPRSLPNRQQQQQEPEFNFGWDPVAAQKVFNTNHVTEKIHLVTSSVSHRERLVETVGDDHFQELLERTKCEGDFFRSLLEVDDSGYFVSYDPVCAFASQYPERVEWESRAVQVQGDGTLTESPSCQHDARIRVAGQIDFHSYLDWIFAAQMMEHGTERPNGYGEGG